jgi:hypothetical protein
MPSRSREALVEFPWTMRAGSGATARSAFGPSSPRFDTFTETPPRLHDARTRSDYARARDWDAFLLRRDSETDTGRGQFVGEAVTDTSRISSGSGRVAQMTLSITNRD